MGMSVAALTSAYSNQQSSSINLYLAHSMAYIQSRYDVACTIYDYDSGAGTPCPSPRQLSDMYGVGFPALPPLKKIDDVSAVSKAFIEELNAYDVVFVNIFNWAQTVSRLKEYFPDKRVVYMSHSLLQLESVYNCGRRGEQFEVNLANQEKLFKGADMVLFPSPWEEICAHRLYGLENTAFVYPLLLPPAKREAEQNNRGDAKFIFIGRYDFRKGLDVVVNSFYQYWQKHRSGSLTIVSDAAEAALIFNVVSDKNAKKLTELINRKLVNFIGWKSNRGDYLRLLTRLAAENSILIAPSTYEPFNIVVTEAISQNIRVIVSRTAGISDLLHGFEDRAALINPFSSREILLAMEKFSNAPQLNAPVKFPINFEMSCEKLTKSIFEEDLP